MLTISEACGGEYVTIGSDAHVVEDVGAGYEVAKRLLKEVALQQVMYRQRKRIVKIEDEMELI